MLRLPLPLLAASALAMPLHAQTTDEAGEVAVIDGADAVGPSALSLSGGVSLVSQYRFRGISLSDEDPALQGTVNLIHRGGLYAGAWASTTDGFGELGGSNLELDLYAGYRTPVASGITLDAGLLYYAYPGAEGGDFEFFEPYANLSGTLGPATAKVGVAYGWEQDALSGNSNVYLFGDLAAAIPTTPVTLKAHLGFSKGDTPLTPGGDYVDWLVGADYVYGPLTFGLSYVDTDLSGRQARRGGATRDIVDAAVVFSLSAGF